MSVKDYTDLLSTAAQAREGTSQDKFDLANKICDEAARLSIDERLDFIGQILTEKGGLFGEKKDPAIVMAHRLLLTVQTDLHSEKQPHPRSATAVARTELTAAKPA